MEQGPTTQPSASGIAARARAILLQPSSEWPRIAGETTEPKSVLLGYALPLAAIGPIATVIGTQAFGYRAMGISIRPSLASSIGMALLTFMLSLASLFVIAFVANFLSPKFGGRENWPAAFRLVAYSLTASFVAGVFGLVPALGLLGLLGLYSLYLFYLGATPVMGVPQDKVLGYTALTVVAAIVLNIVVSAVVVAVAGPSVVLGNETAAELTQYE